MLKLILLKAVAASPEAALMPDVQYAPTAPRKKKKKKILNLVAKSASSIDLGFEWSSGWTNSSSGDCFIFTA